MKSGSQWPIGSTLRFTNQVTDLPGCAHLCQTAVIVLSDAKLIMPPSSNDKEGPQLRQRVYAFAAGSEGWVLPEHLELIPASSLPPEHPPHSPSQRF